ncbi:MAG: hypothetical protein KTR31_18505 [Myxococcales bacterium]|nr:hypothetical protein [Myxococcales bacterium]
MVGWWLGAVLAWAQPPLEAEPGDQTVIYYNARMALADDEPLEAVRLWLLRNAVEDHTGELSPHDEDFNSVTWAALGDLGICQDGLGTDEASAGLWPLALHNWVVRNRGRRAKPKKPRPFDAFELGRQQRFVSIGDVLSITELQSLRLFRGGCLRPRLAMLSIGELKFSELSDRMVSAKLLRFLLERSRATLTGKVRGLAAIEARLFDIDLQITALAAREARRRARRQGILGRRIGLSRGAVEQMNDAAPTHLMDPSSKAARILEQSVDWPASEWLSLSPDRRLFVFDNAVTYGGDREALDQVVLDVVDALAARNEGAEVERWIARRLADDPMTALWSGERGDRLLSLDRESGFRERGVIALHRGVDLLQTGDLPGALRSLAFALQRAPESAVADEVQSLSLRWLSYVASQFELTDDLLVTLQELVPPRDYAVILEDLLWSAAFRADRTSFERGLQHHTGRGALLRRVALLTPLARGDVPRFVRRVRGALVESPSETLRFLDQMVQRLELEDADVRTTHLPTLRAIRRLLAPLAEADASEGRQRRTLAALLERSLAIVEGLGGLPSDASNRDRARSLNPSGEVYAGSVRLAPADPLPWPFRANAVTAPSVFVPLELVPEEWRDADGEWVLGWSIGG